MFVIDIRKLITRISLVLMLLSGSLIAYYDYTAYINNKEYVDLDTSNLLEQNEDYMGWLYIEDTVDLPVVQTDNNKFYLNHSFSKKENKYGCLFIDKDVTPESNNLVIHGHNNNNTTMFSLLLDYKEKEFFENHKEIYFTTKDGEVHTYKVFAVINYDVTTSNKFNLYAPDISDQLIDKIIDNSIYPVSSIPTENNQFITLSTCDTDFYGVDGRIIIVGYRVFQ